MRRLAVILALTLTPFMAGADAWTLAGEQSKISFGSVKKDKVGEVHHFTEIAGKVSPEGAVSVAIDLTSAETWIDIRNQRLGEEVFQGMGTAQLKADVDMAAFEALTAGQSMTAEVDGVLTMGDAKVELTIPVFAMRISDTRALIATDEMIMVQTEELGIDDGITRLMEIAKLPSITRAVPVTFRLVFDKGEQAAAAPAPEPEVVAAAAGPAGDAEAGKKVFRKCRACHEADKEKNKVGPHLVDIVGRPVAAIEDYRYSTAMAEFGGDWTVERLSAYLAKPRDYIKGTKMSFAGLRKDADIENVIAYLSAPE